MTLILREIGNFQQDNKKKLKDIKGEIANTNAIRVAPVKANRPKGQSRRENVRINRVGKELMETTRRPP